MMSMWTWALIGIALVAMALSYNVPRAWWWLLAGGVSFFASTLYADYGSRDMHPILTLSCDALVCLCVFRWSKEAWETGIFLAYLASVFSSLLMVGGFVGQLWVYLGLLEISNLGALIVIGGMGILEMMGRNENSPLRPMLVRFHSPRHTVS